MLIENGVLQIKKNSILPNMMTIMLLIIAILGCIAAYQDDSPLGSSGFRTICRLVLYLLSISALAITLTQYRLDYSLALIPIIWWLCTHVNIHYSVDYDILYILVMLVALLSPNSIKIEAFKAYRMFLIICSLVGIVCYLSYKLKAGIPYDNVPYYREDLDSFYKDYIICYIYSSEETGERLCELFNEPGFCGTMLALVLCADNINLKKPGNIVLMIAGIFTFSIAFLMIILFYCVLLCYKNKPVVIVLILFFVFYFYVLPNLHFESTELNRIVSRLTFSDGVFLADNRETEYFKSVYRGWLESDNLLFGYGAGFDFRQGTLSIRRELVKYGIVGIVLMYGCLIMMAIRKCKKNLWALFFVAVFSLSIYQRPIVFTATYMLVLFGGIEYIKSDSTGDFWEYKDKEYEDNTILANIG